MDTAKQPDQNCTTVGHSLYSSLVLHHRLTARVQHGGKSFLAFFLLLHLLRIVYARFLSRLRAALRFLEAFRDSFTSLPTGHRMRRIKANTMTQTTFCNNRNQNSDIRSSIHVHLTIQLCRTIHPKGIYYIDAKRTRFLFQKRKVTRNDTHLQPLHGNGHLERSGPINAVRGCDVAIQVLQHLLPMCQVHNRHICFLEQTTLQSVTYPENEWVGVVGLLGR